MRPLLCFCVTRLIHAQEPCCSETGCKGRDAAFGLGGIGGEKKCYCLSQSGGGGRNHLPDLSLCRLGCLRCVAGTYFRSISVCEILNPYVFLFLGGRGKRHGSAWQETHGHTSPVAVTLYMHTR